MGQSLGCLQGIFHILLCNDSEHHDGVGRLATFRKFMHIEMGPQLRRTWQASIPLTHRFTGLLSGGREEEEEGGGNWDEEGGQIVGGAHLGALGQLSHLLTIPRRLNIRKASREEQNNAPHASPPPMLIEVRMRQQVLESGAQRPFSASPSGGSLPQRRKASGRGAYRKRPTRLPGEEGEEEDSRSRSTAPWKGRALLERGGCSLQSLSFSPWS